MNKFEATHPQPHGRRLQHLPMAFAATLLSLGLVVPVRAQTYTSIDCPGSSFTHARGINNLGSIVGGCVDADGYVHGFLLRHGNFEMIDVPGADAVTSASGINNRGDIVGRYVDTDGVTHGYLLRHGKFTTIDFPGSIFTQALKIDDLGRVVGTYISEDDVFHGFLLDRGGFQSIDYPGAFDTIWRRHQRPRADRRVL